MDDALFTALPLPLLQFALDGLLLCINPAAEELVEHLQHATVDDIVSAFAQNSEEASKLAMLHANVEKETFPLEKPLTEVLVLLKTASKLVWYEACTFHVFLGQPGQKVCCLLLQRRRSDVWASKANHFEAFVKIAPPTGGLEVSEKTAPTEKTRPLSPPLPPTDVSVPQQVTDLVEPLIKGNAFGATLAECRAIINNMAQMVFYNGPDGRVLFLNQSWHDYTGMSPEESARPDMWEQVFHPDDLGGAIASYTHSLTTGENIDMQYRIKGRDGNFRMHLTRGRPIKDAETGSIVSWVSTITDVEDFVQARLKVQERGEEIEAILRSANLTLLSVTPSGDAIRLGGSATRSYAGLPAAGSLSSVWPDPVLCDRIKSMFAEKDARNSELSPPIRLETTQAGCVIRYTLTHRQHNPLSANHERIMVTAFDATDLIAAETALSERASLMASESRAREHSQQKSAFVSSMSHEIRTPIAAMIGTNEILLNDPNLSPDSALLVRQSLQAGSYLLDLVGAVLDMAKLESAKLDLDIAPIRLKQDIALHTANLASVIQANGSQYRQTYDVPYTGAIMGDKLRINQILTNALSNANKFTKDGTIELTMRQVSESPDAITVQFSVTDSGIGMSQEVMATLFQPFAQADASTARQYGGSGLGLYISRQLAEMMDGTVQLFSTAGKGTSFLATIPFKKNHDLPDVNTPTVEKENSFAPESVQLLLAEDNPVISNITARLLRQMNFNVDCVTDGAQALQALEERPYDLVLMDQQMPVMSGFDATLAIRKSSVDRIKNVKIIALTASAFKADEERCLAAGMNGYLSKPTGKDALKAAICKMLASRGEAVSAKDKTAAINGSTVSNSANV